MRHPRLYILAVLALVACGGSSSRQVVAVVNGEKITASDVAAMLPQNLDSMRADTVKKQVLDNIITRKLFAQEAKRAGMEKDAEYQVELEQKALVNQRLYDTVTAPGNRLTEADVQAAYKLLQIEAHLKVIAVQEESLARRLASALEQGAVFDSLAVKYSTLPSATRGGDAGFEPLLYVEEPLRTSVMALQPGQRTEPVRVTGTWQIAQLVEMRPASPGAPPLEQYRPEFERRLRQLRRREMANRYMVELRDRVTYNPEGLDILCRPVDSITEAEKGVAVAYKDESKYVKVARLLPVAARFPVTLDSAMKKYAVRRAIEEDLMYEDALRMGLDKSPDIVRQLAGEREKVLYNALFKKEISDQLVVTDDDVMDYFRQHRDDFPSPDSNRVAGMIRSRLLTERRDARMQEYLAGLKAKAKIEINQAALAAVKKEAEARARPKQ
ncbi:SurA N-terminal domain-containing protein [candidate division WOR-3 bacterium]|nr:SurA N-terminal domain-containing protein [candidate division WOR-3 bacterium]